MSRNGSGTYTLPAGNPVVTGTTIESNWANTTLSDIATTLTDSLSRSGQGGMTAALRIADGTQGAPGVGFANETGSGFYRAGTGEVWAVVQGAQTLNLDANGVYVPADKTTTVDGAFVFNEAGADKDARFEGDTDANLLFLDASTDRVGVGTNTPDAKLTVNGVGAFGDGAVGAPSIANTGDLNTGIWFPAADTVAVSTGGVEAARFDSSGNLGLGVTPSAWTAGKGIEVAGTGLRSSLFASDSGVTMLSSNYYYNGADRYVANGFASRYYQFAGQHIWNTAASGTAGNTISFTQAMTLDASGNLQIGNTSYAYRVAASRSSDGIVGYFRRDGSTVNPALTISCNETGNTVGFGTDYAGATSPAMTFATQGTERARITSGGKLLLGTTTTGGTLTVDGVDAIATGTSSTYAITCGNDAGEALAFGSDASYAYVQSFGSRALIINQQGNEVRVGGTSDQGAYNLQCNGTGVWGAGAYVNGSDERLKNNIQTLNDGLAVVTQLRPVTFQYKPEHSKDQSVQPGFIAQELQQAMAGKDYVDGVVITGPEYLNVAYQNLIPILTKAIQEQQALITDLRARVQALEAKP